MNYLRSKTLWFNTITFLLAIVALPEFISLLPVTALPYITLVGSMGNMILRIYFAPKPLAEPVVAEESEA